VTKITEAQVAEATRRIGQEIDDDNARDAAEERYFATVAECNFNDCVHFDAKSGHCPLDICFYDIKEYEPMSYDDDDDWEDGGFEWVG